MTMGSTAERPPKSVTAQSVQNINSGHLSQAGSSLLLIDTGAIYVTGVSSAERQPNGASWEAPNAKRSSRVEPNGEVLKTVEISGPGPQFSLTKDRPRCQHGNIGSPCMAYLDYNSTTPVASEAVEAMMPWLTARFWNAASSHPLGMQARDAVECARQQVADLIGANPHEIIFTSGSTESINLALKGACTGSSGRTGLVTLETEHKAVLDVASWLESQGSRVSRVAVDSDGQADWESLGALVDDQTAVVSVMAANNETGVVSDLEAVSSLAHSVAAIFHTDATQAVGKVPFDVEQLDVDLASISAHKIYGPKGVGALYVRRTVTLEPIIHGGGHEGGLRSGTLNVTGIVGFGVAAELAAKRRDEDAEHASRLVAELVARFKDQLPGVELVAADAPRLPNTINIRFKGADADAVMANAQEISVSSGSACTSRVPAPSHVLVSMGLSHDDAAECLRFSVGRPTTSEEIRTAVSALSAAIERVRSLT